jgi:fructokinase
MILCCGESLIDMIPQPTAGGEDGFVPHPGGAVFNTAITLGRLGASAGMVTGLSTDLFGHRLRQALEDSNVDTTLVIESDLPTTLAFVHLNGGQATYTFYDENTAGRSLTADRLPALPKGVDALFFGGISLCSEPAAESYRLLAEAAAPRRTLMLDPNIRPNFIRDEVRYRTRLERLIGCADIIKVSVEDLDWIFPGKVPAADKAARLAALGPAIVILTEGERGALAVTSSGNPMRVPAERAEVVDTVAAGDTFNGAFLARLDQLGALDKKGLRDLAATKLHDALTYAARAAAITVSRAGANPPWASELS